MYLPNLKMLIFSSEIYDYDNNIYSKKRFKASIEVYRTESLIIPAFELKTFSKQLYTCMYSILQILRHTDKTK